jgi:hypothetical protein
VGLPARHQQQHWPVGLPARQQQQQQQQNLSLHCLLIV